MDLPKKISHMHIFVMFSENIHSDAKTSFMSILCSGDSAAQSTANINIEFVKDVMKLNSGDDGSLMKLLSPRLRSSRSSRLPSESGTIPLKLLANRSRSFRGERISYDEEDELQENDSEFLQSGTMQYQTRDRSVYKYFRFVKQRMQVSTNGTKDGQAYRKGKQR
ncbi:hypothetical protein RJ640_024457 [Escallonia rubra]|uniref:Uncharacterized protein n=1 Tax=Escallonia rubra TaxID=112253 RepID=A0AA88UIL5_9ASTE|nr:hypothetical protein RJ640_024457 [Escallonia rubra]